MNTIYTHSNTALFSAKFGRFDGVNFLLRSGADVNIIGPKFSEKPLKCCKWSRGMS